MMVLYPRRLPSSYRGRILIPFHIACYMVYASAHCRTVNLGTIINEIHANILLLKPVTEHVTN
jgi:hypothetical protein